MNRELKSSEGNVHLYRAIVRSLQKPLCVLLTNLSAYLSPLLALPAVSPTTTLNPTQIHALAIATFAAELLEKFQELTYDGRINGLMDIREGLISLVTRVTNYLVSGLKNELMQLVDALEVPTTDIYSKNASKTVIYHPSVVALQTMLPLYIRHLTRCATFADTQHILATLLISTVWRAIVALAHRPRQTQTSQMTGITKNRSPIITPPVTPPPSRFAIRLPPSRPSSPHVQPVIASTAADAHALYELLCQLPRPTGESGSIRLAGEAVDEAFNSLKALGELLGEAEIASREANPIFKLAHNTLDLPLLIVLPVLLQYWSWVTHFSIANMVGLSDQEYRKVCLSGFGRAEECEAVVAQRVLDTLWEDTKVNPNVVEWIENEILAD
jgi:hypothetical protein